MPSRQVHTVRFVSPDDADPTKPSLYIDVEVVDAVSMFAPNGQGIYLDMTTADPQVTDNTGDGSGRDSSTPTRATHMERLTNNNDTTQFFDVEILDAVGFTGPNGQQTFYSVNNEYSYDSSADPDSNPPFTRNGTVTTFTDPDNKDNVLQVLSTDTLTVNGPIFDDPPNYYGQVVFKLQDGDSYDPTGSADNPPPNTDPDPYIKLLKGGGPWLGKDLVVKQGPFWKITKVAWGGTIVALQFQSTIVSASSVTNNVVVNLPQLGLSFNLSTLIDTDMVKSAQPYHHEEVGSYGGTTTTTTTYHFIITGPSEFGEGNGSVTDTNGVFAWNVDGGGTGPGGLDAMQAYFFSFGWTSFSAVATGTTTVTVGASPYYTDVDNSVLMFDLIKLKNAINDPHVSGLEITFTTGDPPAPIEGGPATSYDWTAVVGSYRPATFKTFPVTSECLPDSWSIPISVNSLSANDNETLDYMIDFTTLAVTR